MSESFPSPATEPEWAAFAAIDWADQKNFWRLLPVGSQRFEEGVLENTPEAVEAWAASLEQRFSSRPIAICLEQSRGPLVCMLSKYPHLVLFPVHPTTAARYRETFNFTLDGLAGAAFEGEEAAKTHPTRAATTTDLVILNS